MNKLSVVILCTNAIKGTKSLGSIGLLKLNKSKNILDYHIHNVRSCWPDAEISTIISDKDYKFIRYAKGDKDLTVVDYCLDEMSNESESFLRGINKNNINNNFLVLDISCILDKNIFKKISSYDTSQSYIIANTHVDYCSKLGCIVDIEENTVNNIFFDLPNKILKYYYICNNDVKHMLGNNVCRSKFLFENLNDLNRPINLNSIRSKKCKNIHC